MRKEIIFAVFIGMFLSGLFLYGLYLSRQASTKLSTPKPAPIASPTAAPNLPKITLFSPKNHSVFFQEKTKLKGQIQANSPLAAISEQSQQIIESDAQGLFETDLNLIGGENLISLATPSKNTLLKKELTLIYTTAQIDPEEEKQASEEAEINTDEQVKGVIDSIIKGESATTLTGLAGLVESLDEKSLTLNSQDESYQIGITDNTAILKANKEISLEKIAINDKLIVIGASQNDPFTLNALRIIVTSNPPSPSTRFSVYGTIKEINADKSKFTLALAGQSADTVISIPKKYPLKTDDLTIGASMLAILKQDTSNGSNTLLVHKLL